MKKLILLIILCNLSLCAYAKYSGGTGEPNDPFLIATPEDLNAIGDDPNDWDKHFLMTADINMASYSYTTALIAPDTIDSTKIQIWDFDGIAFSGTFDGNNHKIISIIINGDNSSYLGLFGKSEQNSEIKNLKIINVNINSGEGSKYIGGLCGDNYGTIKNCFVTGKLLTEGTQIGFLCGINRGVLGNCNVIGNIKGALDIGGLSGGNMHGQIRDCNATCSIIGNAYTGGISGYNLEGTIINCVSAFDFNNHDKVGVIGGLCGMNDTKGKIINCYASGRIISGDGSSSLGGLCGYNYGEIIKDSSASFTISSGIDSGAIGGLCGGNGYGTIRNCSAKGYVSGGNQSENIGGLCGYNAYALIINCNANSIVSGGNNLSHLGGLVGTNREAEINRCLAFGSVNGGDNSQKIGGICGNNLYGGKIINSYANCSVKSINGEILGGLCGSNYRSTINNCFSTSDVNGGGENSYRIGGLCGEVKDNGEVNNCYATGYIIGGYNIGGISGDNYKATINNCYSTCSINGLHVLGGLCGSGWYTFVTNSYFLDPNDGGGPDNGFGEPLKDEQMKLKSSFVNWDFNTPIWKMCEYVNDYPRLWWEEIDCCLESKLFMIPRVLNPHSRRRMCFALMLMPNGITKSDFDRSEKLILYPAELQSRYQFAFDINRHNRSLCYVIGVFDQRKLSRLLDQGTNDIEIVGWLKDGQCFTGEGRIRVVPPK